MNTWLDALGILCVAAVQGYLLVFTARRLLPPVMDQSKVNTPAIVTLLAAVGLTGPIGLTSASLQGNSMVGPYGIGLVIGLTANALVMWRAEWRQVRISQLGEPQTDTKQRNSKQPPNSKSTIK